MRWSTTLGAWARREAVLVSVLVSGAAITALAGPLGVPWFKVAGPIVAVVGAIARVMIIVGRVRLESAAERTELSRLLRIPVLSIADIDPTLIGIDRAEQKILPGEGVPQYVRRAADNELRQAIAAALLDISAPWIIVVEGPSKVGKSRSLFHALYERARTTPLELVAPVSGDALRLLMTPGRKLRTNRCATVLWLDDLEPFLNNGVTFQTLREWHTAAAGRIVAATYGGKGSDLIANSAATGLATIASDVLQHARRIPLQTTTADELATLTARLQVAEAASLERHGLAAYLVAGPALETKLNTARHGPGDDACSDGVALVYAAVDWARCGRTDPITDDTLRRLWPNYIRPSVGASDGRFERALIWALKPVAGSIGLLQPTGSYQAFDYVVRLVRDNADAKPPHDASWTAAIESATDEQALAVGYAAYSHARLDVAVEAFACAHESSVDHAAFVGGYNLAGVLTELDHLQEAVTVYDGFAARFGDASEPALREQVAAALVNQAVTLGRLRRFKDEVALCDDITARFGSACEPALREQVAKALVNKGVALGSLERSEDALKVYDEVVSRFGNATEPALREQVANALFNKGVRLGVLKRFKDEVALCDDITARFGGACEPALRERVAGALFNKGVALNALECPEDALRVYEEVLTRFGDATEPALREWVAGALFNKGHTLSRLDRSDDAIAVYDDLLTRFANATEPILRQTVALALAARRDVSRPSG